jgi:hypothetical protein
LDAFKEQNSVMSSITPPHTHLPIEGGGHTYCGGTVVTELMTFRRDPKLILKIEFEHLKIFLIHLETNLPLTNAKK